MCVQSMHKEPVTDIKLEKNDNSDTDQLTVQGQGRTVGARINYRRNHVSPFRKKHISLSLSPSDWPQSLKSILL